MSRFTIECAICDARLETDEIPDLKEFDRVHGIRCETPAAPIPRDARVAAEPQRAKEQR